MKEIFLRNTPEDNDGRLETYPHFEIIEHLARWIKPINYLEIGVRHGTTYNLVKNHAKNCFLVDVDFLDLDYSDNTIKFEMTSDSFFGCFDESIKFCLAFIDGDHSKEQVLKDFMNVKDRVIDDGFVILHDTYPCDTRMEDPGFSGDAWKTALYIKQNFINDWEIITLPFNPGLTIMKKMKINKQLLWK